LDNENDLIVDPFSDSETGKIYTDLPLPHRTSRPAQNETPQMIMDMRSLAYTSEAQWKTSAWLFYTQGTFIADYDDDYPYDTEFVRYYPTYRDLTVPQLRGYFSWRTKLRNGEIPPLVQPYLLLYIYELINCIGTETPEEALSRLRELEYCYTDAGQALLGNLSSWITDFTVNYGLSPELISDSPDMVFDRSLLTLIEYDKHSDDELFLAIKNLSAYSIDESLFVMQYQDDFKAAAVSAFRELSSFFHSHRKNTLCDKYFGKPVSKQYQMFASAVYYNRQPLRNCEVVLDPIHRYSCVNGTWSCEKYYGNRRRNKPLGLFMRALDSIMRERYGFRYKLTADGITRHETASINAALDRLEAEKRRKEAARVEIDLSLLGSIRKAADLTRDSLIVDEDDTDIVELPETVPETQSENLLTLPEIAFLRALTEGTDYEDAARNAGSLPSLLADSVNEKLFDSFGDTVIDFSGDRPEIIEDYSDDIRILLEREEK